MKQYRKAEMPFAGRTCRRRCVLRPRRGGEARAVFMAGAPSGGGNTVPGGIYRSQKEAMKETTLSDQAILNILHADTGMALGCTEPIAVALAVAKAREVLGCRPEHVSLQVSGNIYKNARGVGIPGTDRRGLEVAAALGCLTGSSDRALEVLEDVNEAIAARATDFVAAGGVDIAIAEGVDKLFIQASVTAQGHTAMARVEKHHTNIVRAELDSRTVFEKQQDEPCYTQDVQGNIEGMSVARLYEFARTVDTSLLSDLARGAEANWRIADAGLKKRYGYGLGKILSAKSAGDTDLMRRSMAKVAAGIDARMSGSMLPVMTNSGSGNQGITIYVPVIEAAIAAGADTEALLRALVFANLIPIHIKHRIGPLSALCGIVPASIGAACGIAFLRGATLEQVENVIQLIIANISGLFCDGAKASCAMKASVGIAAAYEAVYMAVEAGSQAQCEGILDPDVEHSIGNLSRIAISAMDSTDREFIDIMTCK